MKPKAKLDKLMMPNGGEVLTQNPAPKAWSAMSEREKQEAVDRGIAEPLSLPEWGAELQTVLEALAEEVSGLRRTLDALEGRVDSLQTL